MNAQRAALHSRGMRGDTQTDGERETAERRWEEEEGCNTEARKGRAVGHQCFEHC